MAQGCASRFVHLAVLLSSILFMAVEAADPPKKTFDFDRHPGKNYFRLVRADSVQDDKNSTPAVISLPGCDTYKDKDATEYNRHSTKMNLLSDKSTTARDCQTFSALKVENPPAGFTVDDGKSGRTQARIVITRADTTDPLVWKFNNIEGKWVTEFADWVNLDRTRYDFQFDVSCEKWWYQSEVHPLTPQYYGLHCQLKIADKEAANPSSVCIGSEKATMAQYKAYGDKAIPGDVTFTNCSDGDVNQRWHLQSVAQEWPDYYSGLPSGKSPFLVDPQQDPLVLFKACTQKGCNRDKPPAS